jgi:integrase
MRQGEILGLTWDRVDFSARQITLEDTKSGRPRYVPVNERLYYLLRRLAPTPAAGPVFVGRRGHGLVEIKKGYVAAVGAAELEDVTFHTLRHTAASWMVQRGVDLYRVKEILGHSTIAMTERYAHLAPNHLADAVAVLACDPGHTWGTMAKEAIVSPQ